MVDIPLREKTATKPTIIHSGENYLDHTDGINELKNESKSCKTQESLTC